MALLERVYTVPLRKVFSKRHVRRGNYAIDELRAFALRHMKGTEVKFGASLSQYIFRDGIKKPPRRVKITAIRDDQGIVRINLFGAKAETVVKTAVKPAAKEAGAEKPVHSTEKPKTEAEVRAEKAAIKAEVKK
jgi:large subunit ribosomal protein L31e